MWGNFIYWIHVALVKPWVFCSHRVWHSVALCAEHPLSIKFSIMKGLVELLLQLSCFSQLYTLCSVMRRTPDQSLITGSTGTVSSLTLCREHLILVSHSNYCTWLNHEPSHSTQTIVQCNLLQCKHSFTLFSVQVLMFWECFLGYFVIFFKCVTAFNKFQFFLFRSQVMSEYRREYWWDCIQCCWLHLESSSECQGCH